MSGRFKGKDPKDHCVEHKGRLVWSEDGINPVSSDSLYGITMLTYYVPLPYNRFDLSHREIEGRFYAVRR